MTAPIKLLQIPVVELIPTAAEAKIIHGKKPVSFHSIGFFNTLTWLIRLAVSYHFR